MEEARSEIGALIGADPKEIVFTSGATESNNISVKVRDLAFSTDCTEMG